MKKLIRKPIMFYLASFMLPFIIIMIALVGLHITPFGDNTLVISDANGLYINYLGYAGRMWRGMEGLSYSFEKGLGGNMMSYLNGMMVTPFAFLFSFTEVANYTVAFTFVSTLNLCLCGLTMYIFLANTYGHKRCNLIFSTTYALMGFGVANVFQAIFFCAAPVLPIMVLGLKKLIQGKNPMLYILAIAYGMMTNAYFGFVLCVASVLFFTVALFLYHQELSGKRWKTIIRYGISSTLGGLSMMVLWLPKYLSLRGGRLDQTGISDFSFRENMPFLEIFSKLFTGANTTSQLVDGLPNIFVGLLPVVLVLLFFLNKRIDKRRKISAGVLLAIYLLSFYISAFDMVMHAGTTTNWFNFRYSYVFSFIILIVAAEEWQYIDELSFPEVKKAFIWLVLAAVIVFSKRYEFVNGSEVLLDFGLLLVVFIAYRLYRLKPQFNPKRTFEAVTILIVSISLFLNYTISTKNIMDWGIKESDYQKTVNAVNPLVSGLRVGDHSFYRMEINKQRSATLGNDPMLYGYYGVGHGGSNERNFVRQELNKLGIQWFDMRNYYAQGIPAATDALLGIKYLIANEDISEEKRYFRMTDMKKRGLANGDEVYDSFQSSYALPIAFVSEIDINSLELTYDDLFDNLNQVWCSVSGEKQLAFEKEEDITFRTINLMDTDTLDAYEAREIVKSYEKKSDKEDSSSSRDVTNEVPVSGSGSVDEPSDDTSSGSISEEDSTVTHSIMDERPEFASSVEFSFTAKKDGPVYVYHKAALSSEYGSYEPVVRYMGFFHEGDEVKGYLLVQGDYVNRITFEEFAGRFRAAYADLDALESMSAIVTSRPSTIEKVKDSHLKGTMTIEDGQELLFTIPWDEGWSCIVDGQEVELTRVLNVFMAAEVTPGTHEFEMKYTPLGLSIGMKVSIAAAVLSVVYLLYLMTRKEMIEEGESKR